jgi:hypothetical protein
VLFPFTNSSWGKAETEPNSMLSDEIPPSFRYWVTDLVATSTLRTDSDNEVAICSALRDQTARSAVAVIRAEPVTEIPSSERDAKPDPIQALSQPR